MISKSTIKLIKSLTINKYRKKENLFLVEGDKNVAEVLNSSYTVAKLFATSDFITANKKICRNARESFEVTGTDIKKASLLKNPQNSLALCVIPDHSDIPWKMGENLSVYLDDIQDPGNLGTIIRICDWFKIENLFCSPGTVDFYNPKVIQASMGSFCRIKILKTEFKKVADFARNNHIPLYGAFLEGTNIYGETLPQRAILIMGNEGNGIQKSLESEIDKKIKIPSFDETGAGVESLNVSVATAIICSEFKRKVFSSSIQNEMKG